MSVNVNLRVVHDKIVQHRVDAPCRGETAKALGKYKLEERLPGLLVHFVSYQEAQGKPEQPLPDDQPVLRGSILNFSVNLDTLLQQQRRHTTLLKGLYRDRVSTVITKYSARFLKPAVADVGVKGGLKQYFATKPEKASATAAALVAVGSQMSVTEFADALDVNCTDRNKTQHVNTVQQLKTEMQQLVDDGAVELLMSDMPLECTIIEHHDIFLVLLPS